MCWPGGRPLVFGSLLQLWLINCFTWPDRHHANRPHTAGGGGGGGFWQTTGSTRGMNGCHRTYASLLGKPTFILQLQLCFNDIMSQVIRKKLLILHNCLLWIVIHSLKVSDKTARFLKEWMVTLTYLQRGRLESQRGGKKRPFRKNPSYQQKVGRLHLNKLYFSVREACGTVA